ncbi:hypothetical protein LZ32DRAFT_406117 [Colletotrichum eremochloae]|nr:hypothetical protein LZ32DRAFT_406117 [Colletotrichum eremochloae]
MSGSPQSLMRNSRCRNAMQAFFATPYSQTCDPTKDADCQHRNVTRDVYAIQACYSSAFMGNLNKSPRRAARNSGEPNMQRSAVSSLVFLFLLLFPFSLSSFSASSAVHSPPQNLTHP